MFYRHSHTRRTSTPSTTAFTATAVRSVFRRLCVTLHNPCNDRTLLYTRLLRKHPEQRPVRNDYTLYYYYNVLHVLRVYSTRLLYYIPT